MFHARLTGTPLPLTVFNHLKTLVGRPMVPHLSIPRIYYQAAKLYFRKKLGFHPKPIPHSPHTMRKLPPTWIQRMAMGVLFRIFGRMETGGIDIRLPDGTHRHFGPSASAGGVMEIKDYRFFTRTVLSGGDIGLGEAFMAGEWDTPDLVSLFKTFADNRDALENGHFAVSVVKRLLERYAHFADRNTVAGSRRNIRRHYDLSNDLYALFLDPAMVYSSAVFESPDDTLETAQQNKLRRLIQKARIRPEDHVLEIGCGWGAFAIEAARQTGCRVTGITISKAQYDLATARVQAAGLADRVDIQLMDYRHMTGTFDKIISIEMLEAVGHTHYKAFFRQCDRLLKPDGVMVLQTITIPDSSYTAYCRERDWIQKHIFPGGHLPSLTALSTAMAKYSRFMIEHVENIGIHYARTLREWRLRFLKNLDNVSALGFDAAFRRKWIYYLSICEAGFAKRVLGDLQIVLTRPNNPNLPTQGGSVTE